MTRVKISLNRVIPGRGSNSPTLMVFTVMWHCFSPSVTTHQPSDWPQIAAKISFVVSLYCDLGKRVHVLFICRTTCLGMKMCCTIHQRFRAVPIAVLFFRLALRTLFSNNKIKHQLEYLLLGNDVLEATVGSWVVVGQKESLVVLYCAFILFPKLLQSILNTLNIVSVLLNVQLTTCLRNSQVPRKYILFIKIKMLILKNVHQ